MPLTHPSHPSIHPSTRPTTVMAGIGAFSQLDEAEALFFFPGLIVVVRLGGAGPSETPAR